MKHLDERLFEQDTWTYLIIEQKEYVNFFNNGYFSPNDYYKDDIDDNKFLLVNTNKNINSSSGQEFIKNQWKRKFGTSPQSVHCILSSNGSIEHAKYIKKIAKAIDLGKVTLKVVMNMCVEYDGHWENKVPYVYGKIFYGNIKENKNTIKDVKRNNDRMLLESLLRKYGKNNIVKSINEMEEHPKELSIYVDYNVDNSMELRKDIMCFRKNGIIAIYNDEERYDNMEFVAISERSKYALTDYMLNLYNYGDLDMIEQYWPELLPYVDGCEGTFINYDNCFESLVRKYGKNGVKNAIKNINESEISSKEAFKLLDELFDKYVPASGKADTYGGEILRAFARLYYRCYNDGDVPFIDYGNETCNSSYRFLHKVSAPGFEREYPMQSTYKGWLKYLDSIVVPFYQWISSEEAEHYFTIKNTTDSRKALPEDFMYDEEDDYYDEYYDDED